MMFSDIGIVFEIFGFIILFLHSTHEKLFAYKGGYQDELTAYRFFYGHVSSKVVLFIFLKNFILKFHLRNFLEIGCGFTLDEKTLTQGAYPYDGISISAKTWHFIITFALIGVISGLVLQLSVFNPD